MPQHSRKPTFHDSYHPKPQSTTADSFDSVICQFLLVSACSKTLKDPFIMLRYILLKLKKEATELLPCAGINSSGIIDSLNVNFPTVWQRFKDPSLCLLTAGERQLPGLATVCKKRAEPLVASQSTGNQ